MDDEHNQEAPAENSSGEADSVAEPAQVDLSGLQGFSIGPSWGDPDFTERPKKLTEIRTTRDRRPAQKGRSSFRDRVRPDRRPARREGARSDARPTRRHEYSAPFKPVIDVSFYPEDTPFRALCQALKQSCRTHELFSIASLILEKPERHVVVLHPLPASGDGPREFYISVPDKLPFDSEEEAITHVMKAHVEQFFDLETVEVDPPRGVFKSVNRCTITGDLLGPPNFHRYSQLEQIHQATRLPKMSLEKIRSKIETVTEPEAIEEWLQKMKTQTRYILKGKKEEGSEAHFFETAESAWRYVLTNQKDKVVEASITARIPGKLLANLPPGSNIRRSIEATLDAQQRFPLVTANHLRGRLRRLHFAVYKKGSKGVSFVCSVKRKSRSTTDTFAEPVLELIEFIEKNPGIHVSKLAEEFLGHPPEKDGGESGDKAKLIELGQNLRWLVTEGYVVEYADGSLNASPPRTPPKPKAAVAAVVVQEPKPAPEAQSEITEEVAEEPTAEAPEPIVEEPQPAETPEESPEPEEAPAEVTEPEAVIEEDQNSPVEESVEEPDPKTVSEELESSEIEEKIEAILEDAPIEPSEDAEAVVDSEESPPESPKEEA